MTKKVFVIAFGLILMADGFAQELSQAVMVPAAGIVVGGGKHYTQTIGEPAIIILASDENLLTEGFQQPRVKLQPPGNKPDGSGVNAYPNPVKDIIWIELFGDFSRTFNISIVNIYGLEVYREELSFTGTFWYKDYRTVSDLKPGFYLIRFISKDGIINRTIKIEKM